MEDAKKGFNKHAGTFITLATGEKYTREFRKHEKDKGKKDFTIAAFFGSAKLEHLLSNPEAVGLRIYYGLDVDGDGKKDKKFVIVAVDENGRDLIDTEKHLSKGEKDGDDILDGGVYCPVNCGPTPSPLNPQ
ncbi:hypothetical protein LX64_01889 [Chitinophaga skermanii]|uniref:Uncharacterized protein n=1 Tax=Chitinophaga skermanii TaxID=331697 RepID=A0A327QSU2_9BACT|nr:hypothetical protein [Chitinophaga skermanii]RAJ06762.1 hypothetical protein LX64_01889 [Chitinophaga skermanii]